MPTPPATLIVGLLRLPGPTARARRGCRSQRQDRHPTLCQPFGRPLHCRLLLQRSRRTCGQARNNLRHWRLGHNPGGFRTWWRRWHGDSDAGDGEHARAQGAAGYCRLPTHLGYFSDQQRRTGARRGLDPEAAGRARSRIRAARDRAEGGARHRQSGAVMAGHGGVGLTAGRADLGGVLLVVGSAHPGRRFCARCGRWSTTAGSRSVR